MLSGNIKEAESVHAFPSISVQFYAREKQIHTPNTLNCDCSNLAESPIASSLSTAGYQRCTDKIFFMRDADGGKQAFIQETLRYNGALGFVDIFMEFKGQVIVFIPLFAADDFIEHFHYSF